MPAAGLQARVVAMTHFSVVNFFYKFFNMKTIIAGF